ncbi:hypothetical protein [Microvirga lotononidis]|uniref:Integral membrane protein n=1 Tax=Microvirga lotononidis TaxID=864069 RepID=I4YWJ1_9HYPH|nr:hypothetical protein [Microvirga lotononidis]EIM28333.1 hypothetical protein MicloDRAFT_00049150 [Microvirga lotononidis]WQO27576.1 hypothetical protein U0023_00225 [Microvirga lotononidis]
MLRAVLATALIATGVAFGASADAQAQGLVPCSREGGYCRVPYPTRVIYGVPGRRAEVFVRGGGIACSNSIFGDPAPGTPKRCAYVARRYDRNDRWVGDGYRMPPRGYDRDFRRYDEGYDRPVRHYVY